MSFCSQVKEEAVKAVSRARHCQLAEIASLIVQYGTFGGKNGMEFLAFTTENVYAFRKYFTLLKKTFNIENGVEEEADILSRKGTSYRFELLMEPLGRQVLQAVKMWDYDRQSPIQASSVDRLLLKSSCCRRAFLRGSFLCCGSVNDPGKSYHLEFVCHEQELAEQMLTVLHGFEIDAKTVLRRNDVVVYVKEGEGIADILNIMETHVSLMDLENVRILKDIGNRVNRGVNCEAANLQRTVSAATKQISDIEYIRDHVGFGSLQDHLREMAEIRLEYPNDSYEELGKRLNPVIGKSGVNHRLRKLGEIADKVRNKN